MSLRPDRIFEATVSVPSWWLEAPRLAAQMGTRAAVNPRTYRFGDNGLVLASDFAPLIDEFESCYGDCAAAVGSIAVSLCCTAHAVPNTPLLVLHFESAALPSLFAAALSLVTPRADLQVYGEGTPPAPGWRLLANRTDANNPMLAASAGTIVIDTRLEPPEFLLNLIVGLVQLQQPAVIFTHGGAATIDGRGVLVTGPSGTGKSTTSASLAGRGHPLLGDETVGIRTDRPELVAFPRTIKLRPGPRAQLVAERLKTVRQGTRLDANGTVCAWVRPSDLFPDVAFPQTAPLDAVFFLRRFADAPRAERFTPTIADLDQLRALTMSLSAVVSWTTSPARRLMRFAQLIEIFSACRCYHLDLGTPDETAAAIEQTVRGT